MNPTIEQLEAEPLTPLEEAVRQLHAAGYAASPSGLYPESVRVVVGPKAIDVKHLKLAEVKGFLAKIRRAQ